MEYKPLADTLRPKNLDGFVGQDHLSGKDGIIRKLIEAEKKSGFFPSLILWGPPGCGKTTLARIISNELNRPYNEFSAVNTSIKEIEKAISKKTKEDKQLDLLKTSVKLEKDKKGAPIVFIDEIHRFNKAQQDALLPHVERGKIVMIGATTENPSFEVISPLLSRSRVIILNQLSHDELDTIVQRGMLYLSIKLNNDTKTFLTESSNGDARVALNILEIAANISKGPEITAKEIEQAMQSRKLNFDLRGEEYYNTISALHKSIRGSDPDAALYWLARMLEAGQDPLYIARRLIRAASEDIGLADPHALVIAVSAFEACDKIGVPECNLALAEAVTYLARSPKSNALYMAYDEVAEDVKNFGNLPVPLHIRNPVTKLMKDVGYGKGYNYFHSPEGEKLPDINYLPEELKERKYITKRFKKPHKE